MFNTTAGVKTRGVPTNGNPVSVLGYRFVRPGDKVLLVSCSYEHSNPGADVFKEYEEITAALKVGSQT